MNDVKVERITAPNGSVFTGAGTNTYLVGENDISVSYTHLTLPTK